VRLGPGVPALVAHPDWGSPAPVVLWMHGRTASKELDPGRYSRWLRAGIAACAIDLPGHGQRAEPDRQDPAATPGVIEQARREIDPALDDLVRTFGDLFDRDRVAIGGMSLGGMIALRRLCDPHRFRAAAVEATTGDLRALFGLDGADPAAARDTAYGPAHDPAVVGPQDPAQHLDGFEPLPLLALHSEADEMVPWPGQRAFLERLRAHFAGRGADRALIETRTWPDTGAPREHVGFGRHANDAKNGQTAFLARALGTGDPGARGKAPGAGGDG